jgi:hypothetical protein
MWVASSRYPCCNGPCIEFNWKTIFAVMRKGLVRIHYALVVGLCVLLAGCGEPALKPGPNWVPKVIGGPIEVRPLPLATELAEDYGKWIRESNSKKLRVYEVVIRDSRQQLNFESAVRRGDSAVGRTTTTFASFTFSNAPNSFYVFEWMEQGKQDSNLVRVFDKPKKFLVHLIQTQDVPIARLQIIAIEGIECTGHRVAIEETSVP